MLSFMTSDTLSHIELKSSTNTNILNLSSFKMGYIPLRIAPPYNFMGLDSKTFDMMYAKYILENDGVFMELMKIIEPLYQGTDIIILVTLGNEWDIITESLQKFLQQRYNIISTICCSPEDYEYCENSTMNAMSVYNFDVDRKRFLKLFVGANGSSTVEKSIVTDDNFRKYYY